MKFLLSLILALAMAFPVFSQTVATAPPNIILILVDDFSMNLMPKDGDSIIGDMPQLAKMIKEGVVFSNYFVTESLCCPSRASIMTGMMPHNTGVLNNLPPFGGIEAFNAHGNEAKSFGPLLQGGGYATAYFGKYLNGYQPVTTPIPPGWSKWVSTNQGYKAFGYNLNIDGALSMPPEHMTDTISNLSRAWMILERQPFFIVQAPYSPHSPYVPAARHKELFLDSVMPKTPAFNHRPDANDPEWLRTIPALSVTTKATLDNNFILRKQANKSIDEMIGAVRRKLTLLGIADNTYVIFTSDNGYHMGEFSLRAGKQTPFDFDVRVPMVIVGPGIAPGTINDKITMNIDIMPTIMQIAGLSIPANVDGKSMFVETPRTMAVIEHLGVITDPEDPDYSGPKAGDPPTYIALRMQNSLYVEYETGEIGYYDMITDPHQLNNIASTLTPERLDELHNSAIANSTCVGSAECSVAQNR